MVRRTHRNQRNPSAQGPSVSLGTGSSKALSQRQTRPSAVVLGGGIAGIATAIYLSDQGYGITLVETRGFLGGRVFSFVDQETGLPVDNGQHLFLGCCHYYVQFLQRLGIFEKWHLQRRLRVRVSDRANKSGLLASAPLPGAFHLLPSLLAYPHLRAKDKLRVLSALLRIKFTDRRGPHLERMTFYQWLKWQGQSEAAIDNLWNLLIVPTLNDDIRDVSAAMGMMIFQEGLLKGRNDPKVGYATDGLSPSLGEPARKYLESLGVRLLLGTPVRCLELESEVESDRIASALLASGEKVTGDFYISALPFSDLLSILPPEARDSPYFQRLRSLETSPIVNIHLWYDRTVMNEAFCAFVDSPLQWVFNKTAILADRGRLTASSAEGGQYINISLSAAWKYLDQPREELAQQFIAAMAEAFPKARESQVKRWLVVKQRHATFRCLPGAAQLRPTSDTPISNLFLAGEWTHTGWPSTMESAVRSGYNAAQAVAQAGGRGGVGPLTAARSQRASAGHPGTMP